MFSLLMVGILIVVIMGIIVLLIFGSEGEPLIGGERDEHGCLVAAGYSWDRTIGACIRDWELDDDELRAAGVAVDYIGWDGLTVVEVMIANCSGCFLVKLTNPEYVVLQVVLSNWEVFVGSFEDCVLAGFPVMESYPRQCNDGSVTWVEVLGSKSCEVDSDCVVFGRSGDCNCGCYNKGDLPSGTGGACFCEAPESCGCVGGVCEGVFG